MKTIIILILSLFAIGCNPVNSDNVTVTFITKSTALVYKEYQYQPIATIQDQGSVTVKQGTNLIIKVLQNDTVKFTYYTNADKSKTVDLNIFIQTSF
jgi:hypothetical protein